MKYLSLNELIEKRKEEIINKNYSCNFFEQMCLNWKQLLAFLKENNLDYNENSKKLYLEYQKNNKSHKYYLYTIHAIQALEGLDTLNIKERSSVIINNNRNEIKISDLNNKILEKYKEDISEYNSIRTITEKIKLTKEIMAFFESKNIYDYNNLDLTIIKSFISEYHNYSYSSKKKYNWALKMFLKFLYENQYIKSDYSILIDKLKYHAPLKMLTVWSNEEIQKIVNSLSNDNPIEKRNKAIVLLAIRLGIRFIDIKNLEFSNIDWKNNTITFVQHKTKVEIQLPLFEDVGNAIIDYIENGRPKTSLKYIFVTHDEKVDKLNDNTNINSYLIKTYQKANINYLSKTIKGIHTFRHTLASSMLKANIPIEIISSVLGHVNNESTKHYIKIDTDSLKTCYLEDFDNEQ